MNKPNGIEKKLNIDSPPLDIPNVQPAKVNINADLNADFDFIRKKLTNAISKGDLILDKALEMVNTDIHPRVVESAAAILRTVCDCSNQLFELHSKMIATKERLGVLKDELGQNTDEKQPEKIKGNIQDIIGAATKRIEQSEQKIETSAETLKKVEEKTHVDEEKSPPQQVDLSNVFP